MGNDRHSQDSTDDESTVHGTERVHLRGCTKNKRSRLKSSQDAEGHGDGFHVPVPGEHLLGRLLFHDAVDSITHTYHCRNQQYKTKYHVVRHVKRSGHGALKQRQHIPANTKRLFDIYTMLEDVGSTLYKCYTNVLCLLGRANFQAINRNGVYITFPGDSSI